MPSRRTRPAVVAGCAVAAAFLAAKALALRTVPVVTWPEAVALPCDDVLLAAVLTTALWRVPWWLAGAVAGTAVLFAAVNVLFVAAVGSPLVVPMLRGIDPAMGDSALLYVGIECLWPAVAVLVAAWLGSRVARHVPFPPRTVVGCAVVAGALWCLLPPAAHAAHRNSWFALVRSALPRAVPDATEPPAAGAPAAAPNPLCGHAGGARGRDVVVVVLESAAARFCSPQAAPPHAMPFLVELANSGLHCPTAYAAYPESIEGQVALFCGVPPRPDADAGDYGVHAQQSLPRRLRPHGYTSGLFHAGRFRFLGMQEVIGPMGFDHLADAATIGGESESSFGIDEEATVDALLRWLEALPRGQHFLACWLPIAGHHPYGSPPGGPFASDTQLGCYRNALHYADRSLRRLWEGLCARRDAESLLLCVVGDHGQAFGEHPGNFGHSFELYEENLRVPLLFHAPGTALRSLRCELPCSHLDVVPTLLDLLGVEPAGDSSSLLRRGAEPVFAFTDWGELLVAVRAGRWKLVHEVQTGRERLFDLAVDPAERSNRAAGEPRVAATLRCLALGFLGRARAGMEPHATGN